MSEDDEVEAAQLRAEYRWQRAQRAKLMRHPDCLDPEHPGCSNCKMKEPKMATIEELEARLAEMQAELEKLKSEKVAEWPKEGDEYWTIGTSGKPFAYEWEDDEHDNGTMAIGHIFRTEEEAEAEIEARKVIAELCRQPGARRFVVGGNNWSVVYNFHNKALWACVWESEPPIQQSVWFESQESARAAIQAVGEERIIKAARWWALGEC